MKQFLKIKYVKKVLAGLIVSLQFAHIGLAAPLLPGDREEQNQKARQAAIEKEIRQKQPDIFLQKEKAELEGDTLPEEKVNFAVKKILLEGDGKERFGKVQAYLSGYEGKRIGLQGIQLIMNRAGTMLLNQGFVTTKILLKEQDLHTGTLTFLIMPGKIETIKFEDEQIRANWKTAFPTRPGRILNIRDLEQGLEQLKRITSRDVDFQIKPGSKEGQSQIVIKAIQKNPVHMTLSLDDSGSEATGKIQLSTGIILENPFNMNDILRLNINHDGEKRGNLYGTKGHGINYSVPDGNFTYSLAFNNYEYHQTVDAGYDKFLFSGESKETRLGIEKLIGRNQNSKTNLEIGIQLKNSHSYIDDTEIKIQERKTTTFQVGVNHRKYIGRDFLEVRLGSRHGVPWLHAQDDPADGASEMPTLRYHIWDMETTYITPMKLGKTQGQYKLYLSGQYTEDRLYASECMSLGNRYTVRGFSGEETIMGDKGLYVQNEISLPLPENQQFFVGLDYGTVRGYNAENLTSRQLIGTVTGIRGALGKNGQYEFFVGWALKKPNGMQEGKPVYGMQFICQF